MPGFYILTIFNYFIVVPASGELPFTCSWILKFKHQSVTFLGENIQPVTFGFRTWNSIRSYGRVEAWAALSFKLTRPSVAFVYFCFGSSVLLSRVCSSVPLRCIFVSNSFRLCIKLCLFTYFSLNSCAGLSYISIFALWNSCGPVLFY